MSKASPYPCSRNMRARTAGAIREKCLGWIASRRSSGLRELATTPRVRGALLVKRCVDPVHLRAELLADDLDLVARLLVAHALEVLLTGPILRNPLAREVARLDLLERLLHRVAGGLADDPLAARQIAVLSGVGDRV